MRRRGSSRGGMSTFNREFAINLAKATTNSMKIHCYVLKSDEFEREDARQHGVNLITAQCVPADPLDWLKVPPRELPHPDIVVGHGRKFGTPAYFITRATKCKWVQFVHVFCEDLGKYKETATAETDTIEDNEKKHKREIELCKAADAVVAVGSRLQQKYSRSLPDVKVEVIIPGILEKFSSESQVVIDRSVVKTFNVFMLGRATFEDRSLKGYDIVANAIGSLGKEFELTFVGSSPGEHKRVAQWFLDKTCINLNQLTIRGYINTQDDLKMMFHESDLVALPSRTEGFGLVALEAISAGIPVLVADESGIAEALQEVEGGKSVIVETKDDAKEVWAQRIRELSRQSPEERQNNAMQLRDNYRKVYSWSTECERFQKVIESVVESTNVKPDAPLWSTMQMRSTPPVDMASSHDHKTNVRVEKIQDYISRNGVANIKQFLENELKAWKEVEVNIAVTGDSGAGKSTFINAIRGLHEDDPGAAKVDYKEGTTEPTCFVVPTKDDTQNIKFWDLPGIGTETFPDVKTYCDKMRLEKYDTFLLFTKDRFTSLDKKLAQEITSMNKRFFLIRSKIDQDIINGKRKRDFNQDEMFRDIKEHCSKHLKGLLSNTQDVFLISSHYRDPKVSEFDKLVDAIEKALPQHQRESLTLSLCHFSTASIKRKVQVLEDRIVLVAAKSAAVAFFPIPGASTAADLALIGEEETLYRTQLGIPNEESVEFLKLSSSSQKSTKLLCMMLTNIIQVGGLPAVAAYCTEEAVEQAAKAFPFIGAFVSSTMSFGSTYLFLKHCLKTTEQTAHSILKESLDKLPTV